MASASASVSSSLVIRRLYRSLLRTAKPFTPPSPNAIVLSCLLHRTGIDDNWNAEIKTDKPENSHSEDQARDLTFSYANLDRSQENDPYRNHQRLFRRLLREVVAGPEGIRKLLWPSQVDATRLREVVRREFRDDAVQNISISFNESTRRQVAFLALRELNKKLSSFDTMAELSPEPLPQQAAWHVSPLPFAPPSSYLRPGAFLISHPHMVDSFFSRSVICVLDHAQADDESSLKRSNFSSTYGIIVNRVSVNAQTGKNLTLGDAFEKDRLPTKFAEVFGDAVVKDGGPVHASIQMVYSALPDEEELSFGGLVIPMIPEGDSSPAMYSDRATYFQGDISKASDAVEKGRMDRGTTHMM
jgi:hypothetical protein